MKNELSHSKITSNPLDHSNNDLYFLARGLTLYNQSLISKYSSPKTIIAEAGASQIFHFQGKGKPILLIPSHINTSSILDFSADRSLVLRLKNSGLNPYLVNWDSASDIQLDFEGYLNLRLKPLVEALYAKEGKKIILIGHCMGGLFAISLAQLFPELIEAVATLATPWHFHAYNFLHYPFSKYYAEMLSCLLQQNNIVPKELIHLILYFINSQSINQKYVDFGKGIFDQVRFVALENWLNEGLDMSGILFADCIQKFIIHNQPYLNRWYVNKQLIYPGLLKQKSFCAIAKMDKITPISATLPLSIALRRNTTALLHAGHVGMIISNRHSVVEPLSNWIKTNFE